MVRHSGEAPCAQTFGFADSKVPAAYATTGPDQTRPELDQD